MNMDLTRGYDDQRDGRSRVRSIFSSAGDRLGRVADAAGGVLDEGRYRFGRAQGAVADRGRDVAYATHRYAQDHAWGCVAAAAAVGIVVGFLIARR